MAHHPPIATIVIDSDWATFQLTSEGARLEPLPGAILPPGLSFTDTGVLFGQPNEKLVPQAVEFPVLIFVDAPTVNFITGKGDGGTGGPRAGIIIVKLGGREYPNTVIADGGLNIKVFNNVPK